MEINRGIRFEYTDEKYNTDNNDNADDEREEKVVTSASDCNVSNINFSEEQAAFCASTQLKCISMGENSKCYYNAGFCPHKRAK